MTSPGRFDQDETDETRAFDDFELIPVDTPGGMLALALHYDKGLAGQIVEIARVEAQNAQALRERQWKDQTTTARRGQWLAFTLAFLAIGTAAVLALQGAELASVAMAALPGTSNVILAFLGQRHLARAPGAGAALSSSQSRA